MTRLSLVGATGTAGGYALRYALNDPSVDQVTAIGRRTVGISHPELREVLHRDFADCWALAEVLSGQDAAVFCLGTYRGGRPRHRRLRIALVSGARRGHAPAGDATSIRRFAAPTWGIR
jgi:putative NADH-flavin reductase